MGLDQYAAAHRGKGFTNEFDETEYPEEIYLVEWRKHPNLQGFMQNLCGGRDINGVDVKLTLEDIDALEEAIDESALPETQGFFFGADSSQDETRKEKDLEFIESGLKAINHGEKVFYSCWW